MACMRSIRIYRREIIGYDSSMANRILIVDDNVDMIEGLSWYLEAAGFVVSSRAYRSRSFGKI